MLKALRCERSGAAAGAGDQLSFELSALEGLDVARDRVLLAEVAEEAGHVPHHPQKIAFIFSAMRHFAEALRLRGVAVDYVRLDDPANSGSLAGELLRFATLHRPRSIHVTEAGDWRVEQTLNGCGLPITWHADRRFICSRSSSRVGHRASRSCAWSSSTVRCGVEPACC